jgi:uncharacterized membrane protein (UPF0127 family)
MLMITIQHKTAKLIKNLLLWALLLSSVAESKDIFQMKNAQGQVIQLRLALTFEEHTKGLSGLKSKDFKSIDGMLFVDSQKSAKRFWMPNTYFNLDIIFLDEKLKIVAIEKNVPFHPGLKEPPTIYRTETYQAQHVLETKANSDFSKKLKVNDQLEFIGPTSLSEIILKTHQKQ